VPQKVTAIYSYVAICNNNNSTDNLINPRKPWLAKTFRLLTYFFQETNAPQRSVTSHRFVWPQLAMQILSGGSSRQSSLHIMETRAPVQYSVTWCYTKSTGISFSQEALGRCTSVTDRQTDTLLFMAIVGISEAA